MSAPSFFRHAYAMLTALVLVLTLTAPALQAQEEEQEQEQAPELNAESGNETEALSGPPLARPVPSPFSAPEVKNLATHTAPTKGAVTNLPLPRFVTLKAREGNARRGPGLTHRIDWVFTRAGMPLRLTAEYENWRRIEDADGLGGWVHYTLLSGVRSVLFTPALSTLYAAPSSEARVVLQAEGGVIGRIQECNQRWCLLNLDGQRAWAQKSDLWGIDPDEIID